MIKSNNIKRQEKNKNVIIFEDNILRNHCFKTSCVFLDRDGVVIEDCHYIKDPKDVSLCPGAKEFIRFFYQQRTPIVIVTNQSGISKKYLSWNDYKRVTSKLINLLGEPNPITAIYANSYTSIIPSDNWRKPNPSMLIQASRDLNLDLKSSIMIGDRETDLIAGTLAEIPKLFHVCTGHGIKERKMIFNKYRDKNVIDSYSKSGQIYYLDTLRDFPFDRFENLNQIT